MCIFQEGLTVDNTMRRRVRVEIDLAALTRNYRRIVAHVRPANVLCVLKANAYGLGVGAYARTLAEAGCTMFGGNPGRPVTVDISEISDDCWYEVGHHDRDGLPGGPTDPRVEVHCP